MFKILIVLLCAFGVVQCHLFNNDDRIEYTGELPQNENGTIIVALDVRSPEEVKANPAIKATNIPLAELKDHLDELKEAKTIFVFCETGGRSKKAELLLKSKGIENVVNLKSWRNWNKLITNKQ